MKRSLEFIEKPKISQLCDCLEECPAHPKNRLMHIGDLCIHADGGQHRIKPKMNITQVSMNSIYT